MESLLLHEKVKIANTDCCKLGASLFDCASLIASIVWAIFRDYMQQSHTECHLANASHGLHGWIVVKYTWILLRLLFRIGNRAECWQAKAVASFWSVKAGSHTGCLGLLLRAVPIWITWSRLYRELAQLCPSSVHILQHNEDIETASL